MDNDNIQNKAIHSAIAIQPLKIPSHNDTYLTGANIVTCNMSMHFDLDNFKEGNVDLRFIALSLSKLCRFTGHTGTTPTSFYSVAQHSVIMAQSILLVTGNPIVAMQALMHDASEAYIGDIISPLKRKVKDIVKPIEDNIEQVIFKALHIPYPLDPLVKKVDINICQYELEFIVNPQPQYANKFDFWNPEKSFEEFMTMYDRIRSLIAVDSESYVQDHNGVSI